MVSAQVIRFIIIIMPHNCFVYSLSLQASAIRFVKGLSDCLWKECLNGKGKCDLKESLFNDFVKEQRFVSIPVHIQVPWSLENLAAWKNGCSPTFLVSNGSFCSC